MTLKQFLKPDWRKIVLFVILFILSLLISYPGFCVDGTNFGYCEEIHGFPLSAYTTFGEQDVVPPEKLEYIRYENIFGFIFNLIFWYLLSCLIVWIYDKVKKKK